MSLRYENVKELNADLFVRTEIAFGALHCTEASAPNAHSHHTDLERQLEQNKHATTLAYPFDRYRSYITFLAARTDDNTTFVPAPPVPRRSR